MIDTIATKSVDGFHSHLLYRQTIIVILILLVTGVLFNETNLNLLVSRLFADGADGFPLKQHWIVRDILHHVAAKLSGVLASVLVGFNIYQWFRPTVSLSLKTLISARYLMWSWLCSTLVIGYLKSVTKLPCPWNIHEFGGTDAYLSLLDAFSSQYPVGHCFPSAHATGGYGLIGLAFVAVVFGKPFRYGALPALSIGALYGGAQMTRGAHFISHDLFSIAICLGFALVWARFYLHPKLMKLT
jgi:membrane-associated PAP2 superfamily phosphatase